jgi:hypothetical protein
MAATSTPDTVRTITLPVVQGSETAKTIRYYEAGVEAKNSPVLFWASKALLEQLGAESVEDLTIMVTATKTDPGITVDPPLEAPEPEAGTASKTEQRELDRHAKLRDQYADAYAAVETSDHPLDSDEGRKLAAKRDQIAGKLTVAADKLRARGYALEHDDTAPTKSA